MRRNVYSVGQVNSYIQNMFAQDFMMGHIAVRGEISNCKYHSSGHIYFTLKDETGVLKAVMFRGSVDKGLAFHMDVGDRVVVLGEIRIYERDGQYQLYAQQVTRDGVGILYQKFMERKKELEEMGMFAQEYKRDIPRYASRVGIVTAPTGAAIRDIQNISHRRNPYVQLLLYPALVQGEGAAASIVQGIYAMEQKNVDVIIVGRGGGSMEDLWAFNEEIVARAIFECSVPVISAVGHETDYTIADYVADLRAPTPSAAAELAVYEYSEVKEQILNCESLLRRAINQKLLNERMYLEHSRLKLQTLHPRQKLNEKRQRTVDAENTLRSLMERHLTKEKHRLALCAERMKGLSPLEKLSQGYSYVCNAQGQNIKKTDQVREGDLLQIYVTDGQIETYVTDTVKLEGERGQSSHKQ